MIDNIMTRDSEIPAIFNPKRVRAPSVVVTGNYRIGVLFDPKVIKIWCQSVQQNTFRKNEN